MREYVLLQGTLTERWMGAAVVVNGSWRVDWNNFRGGR